jgi:hypothetical protein
MKLRDLLLSKLTTHASHLAKIDKDVPISSIVASAVQVFESVIKRATPDLTSNEKPDKPHGLRIVGLHEDLASGFHENKVVLSP